MDNLKLVKMVSGEFMLGEEENGNLKDVAVLQVIPQQGGAVSLTLIPIGFPFEQQLTAATISCSMIMYEVKEIPTELKDRYIELKSNIKIARPDPSGKVIL